MSSKKRLSDVFLATLTAVSFGLSLPAWGEGSRIALPALVYPLMGPRMSSDFGSRTHPVYKTVKHHHGIDLAAPQGSPIRVIATGTVVYADPYKGYGLLIVVQHPDGMTSHYGHCERLLVQPGEQIKAGQVIGTVGSTGISTGPHLHFEIRKQGKPQDPERYLPGLALVGAG